MIDSEIIFMCLLIPVAYVLAYIIPEGWWEYVTFSEEFGVVDAEVIAWMPLPEPYIRKKVRNE